MWRQFRAIPVAVSCVLPFVTPQAQAAEFKRLPAFSSYPDVTIRLSDCTCHGQKCVCPQMPNGMVALSSKQVSDMAKSNSMAGFAWPKAFQ